MNLFSIVFCTGCQLLFTGGSADERLAFFPTDSVREKDVSVPANQKCTFYYGNQFYVQYLDCTGSWRSISQQSVLDTIELTPGWSTTQLKIRVSPLGKLNNIILRNGAKYRLIFSRRGTGPIGLALNNIPQSRAG